MSCPRVVTGIACWKISRPGWTTAAKTRLSARTQETYYAAARPGWFFDHWATYCQNAAPPNYDCTFNVPAATVNALLGADHAATAGRIQSRRTDLNRPVTDQIVKVSSVTDEGYVWDYYRNEAYPCSASGYQTFILGQKVGSSSSATAPLWVKMHGGGVGFFDSNGVARPNTQRMDEESRTELLGHSRAGLMADVKDAGYRILVVSMCSHDLYAGFNNTDPNNPNTTPDGAPRPTTGLVATKSAIQFAQQTYPTDDTFLHGGSAGSAGTYQRGVGDAGPGHRPRRDHPRRQCAEPGLRAGENRPAGVRRAERRHRLARPSLPACTRRYPTRSTSLTCW